METAAEIRAEHVLLAATIILASGSILGFIARHLRMPDIVLFLLVGILLGPQVTGILDVPATSTLSWAILIFTASYILFDGGATLDLSVLKKVWISLAIIVTVGVLITTTVTGFAAATVLHLPLTLGLLLGAALCATDPATLVPVFKQVHIRDKVSQFVISESAFNDPMGAILTFALLALAVGGGEAPAHIDIGGDLIDLVTEAGLGVGIGLMLGYGGAFFVAHEKFGFLMEYLPLVTLIAVIGGYLGATGLHASGFMAAFVAGLVMGNMHYFGLKMPHGDHARFEEFVGTTSLISRMFIFILLGSQVNISLIAQYWWQGLVVVFVFMFIARPLTVFICTLPDKRSQWTLKELLFVCWTRETGVIPGALASILVGANVPHADVLAAIIFMAILITIIAQATTAAWVADKLGLMVEKPVKGARPAPAE